VDKNYAGVLIIWDRMFGTFEPERRDEPLVYGLIEQVDSFNPFYLEVIIINNYYLKLIPVNIINSTFQVLLPAESLPKNAIHVRIDQ
jgi:hypothetical protein